MNCNSTHHGCALILGNRGIFIRGRSGSGKSRLSSQLILAWQERGCFSSWVADDRVILEAVNTRIIARAPAQISGQIEQRFAGIFNVPHEECTQLDLILDLVPQSELERLPEPLSTQLINNASELQTIQVPEKNMPLSIEIVETCIGALFD